MTLQIITVAVYLTAVFGLLVHSDLRLKDLSFEELVILLGGLVIWYGVICGF